LNNKITVLVAEDDAQMLELIDRVLSEEGYQVIGVSDGQQAIAHFETGDFDIVLTDIKMPGVDGMEVLARAVASRLDQPIILMTAFGSIASAVEAMQEGAFHYLAKPFDLDELLEVIDSAACQIRELKSIEALQMSASHAVFPIVFRSSAMARLLAEAREVAETKATVLIVGQTGTGKELLAEAIHEMSARVGRAFVTLDSSAIPEALLESELFGHKKGSFTGAVTDKPGIIEEADCGTLFLDEVGNLALPVQAKLLRFLQNQRYRRVGEVKERSLDVRLISASNRDLRELVSRDVFRDDLFYRLSVITLEIPCLKDRREDIPPLVFHFVRKFNSASSYRVEGVRKDAMAILVDYSWPGNVLELENVLERAMILREAGLIAPCDLPDELRLVTDKSDMTERSLEEVERQHILDLLTQCDGNQSRVARILGISRRTVYRKLKSWGAIDE